jgi:hypothetical protein
MPSELQLSPEQELAFAKKLTSGDRAAYMHALTKIAENPKLRAAVRAIQVPAVVAGTQQ